jgi:hypothetical protein
MASTVKHLRSSTANKRPTASGLADGQLAINTASGTPGLFLKDNAGAVVKVGPVHVGAAAPNATPAGSSGNSKGELWVNDTTTIHGLNYYTGSAFVNLTPSGTVTTAGLVELATNAETQAGTDTIRAVTPSGLQSKVSDSTSTTSSTTIASSTAVKAAFDLANAALPKSGGRVTGNLEIGPTGSLSFEGSTDDNFETFLAVVDPTADRTITFPNVTGTVVTTGDTGTVTSTMITDGTIVNADINASAGIVDTKLATISTAGKVSNSATTAVSANTVNAIVTRDGSGNFSAGTITAALTGNASTATKLSSARTFAVTGDITGTVSSDLTSGASIATSIAAGVIIDADVNASAAIGLSKLATGALPSGITVASANIVDGTIVNADINASAAIALSKLATGALPSAITVASTNIVDGTIVNADVNASAAIAGTKIAPNFGSQTITTTGIISPALGTAAAPSIAFTGDLNTGIYSPGADQVAVATNGVQRLTTDTAAVTSTLPVVHPLGAVGTPSITFTGDLNTGFWSPTADTLAASTAGSERLRITSAGLVGIGTSAPDSPLNVRAGANNATAAEIASFGRPDAVVRAAISKGLVGGTINGIAFGTTTNHPFALNTNGSERIYITNTGNVGIGTTSPVNLLDVNGTIGYDNRLLTTSTTGDGTAASPSICVGFDYDNGFFRPGSNIIGISTAGFERARIDSSGRLLVGTSTPLGPNNSLFQIAGDSTAAGLQITRFNSTDGCIVNFSANRNATVGSYTTVQNGDELARLRFIAYDGASQLVAAQITSSVDGTPGANDMPGRLVFSTTAAGASTPTERMRIDSSGNVGINRTPAADARLDVNGLTRLNTTATPFTSALGAIVQTGGGNNTGAVGIESTALSTATRHHISFSNPNGVIGSISTSASATSFVTSSDYRLKENVVDLDGAIDRLNQLPVHRFNFIADPDTVVDGFIAHEAAEVVPECVTGTKDEVDEDGNPVYQGIDQSKIVPLLTAALQEAIAKIETLEQRLTAAGID